MRIKTYETKEYEGSFVVFGTREEIEFFSNIGDVQLSSVSILYNAKNITSVIRQIMMKNLTEADDQFKKYYNTLFLNRTTENYSSPIPLFNHQKTFVKLALEQDKIYNASEQGTGKTYASLAFVRHKNIPRVIIVCPKGLIQQWYNSCKLMNMPHYIRTERDEKTDKFYRNKEQEVILIVNYDKLKNFTNLDTYDMVIIDECSAIKNPKTARTVKVISSFRDTRYIHLLNGTPIGNDVGDLYIPLVMLKTISVSYMDFMSVFSYFRTMSIGLRQIQKPYGIRNVSMLLEMLDIVYFRVNKITCLDLPVKHKPEMIRLSMTPYQRTRAAQVRREGLSLTDLTSPAVRQLREHQMLGGFSFPIVEERPALTTLNPKIMLLDSCIENIGEDNIIIWCRFNEEVKELGKRYKFPCLTGDNTPKEIEETKAKFNKGEIQGLVVQIAKMAEGHDLYGGNLNFYYSLPYSWIKFSQSTDRTHRFGQTRGVRYLVPYFGASIDMAIIEALEEKKEIGDNFTYDTTEN